MNARFFIKAFVWLVGNLIYALTPFLIIMFVGSMSTKLDLGEDIERIEVERITGIMFIFIVLMGAVTIDFILSKKMNLHKHLTTIILGASGFMFLCVCLVYVVLLDNKSNEINYHNLYIFSQIVVVYPSIFSVSVKTLIFKKEE
jgi:hypothetical protein